MGPDALRELARAARVLKLDTTKKIERDDVRCSFLQAVRESHPDKGAGSVNEFNEVMSAYNKLNRYFDERDEQAAYREQHQSSFGQPVYDHDMVFSEQENAYFFQCRCGELVEVSTIAIALGVKSYTCETCSLLYTPQWA
ncbi:Chaperone J-domain superfamily protein, putative [Babesia bigemina]|uniref:Chaperone J-domain superfamily protein, putative n=1 Tax=Babesia bigemina TaxID=5866 RepID=A0A061DB71_BABBI|nr:Chaperone J-domain superfamily protein, putative [Babesia bigemina]CDR96159.1 Chaperone J-domain superfamily protein, putative [Babesia bigemina]|eukprot:XP_012768345.1 Chaperone J-domain superfamily protein, putative [Babesia bigemina]